MSKKKTPDYSHLKESTWNCFNNGCGLKCDDCPDKSKATPTAENTGKQTPTPWRQGVVLLTPRTRHWSKEELGKAEAHENLMVFSNFHTHDDGRSRVFVCKCESPEDAQLIVTAVNSYSQLKADNEAKQKRIEELEGSVRRYMALVGNTGTHIDIDSARLNYNIAVRLLTPKQ